MTRGRVRPAATNGSTRNVAGDGATGRSRLLPVLLGLGVAAVVAAIIGSGLGFRSQPTATAPRQPASPHFAGRTLPSPIPQLGRVVFAEGLDPTMELESRRSQFAADDTIAWRAEFVDAPMAAELTVVIAWQSIRERMELSRGTIALDGADVMSVVRESVPIGDLVPTAGLYSVSYYEGDAKLAEGVFEVLPPNR